MPLPDREEYIEQSYLFRRLTERASRDLPTQELLLSIKQEILAGSRLALAIDYLAADLRLYGVMHRAMAKLEHYFSPFQAYIIGEAEHEAGRFDLNQALAVLEREAAYRAAAPTAQGLFLYQFESLCRNRLNYDRGLTALARDPFYEQAWSEWILDVRRQVGFVDIGELIYQRSAFRALELTRTGQEPPTAPILFGEKEGRIAVANRRRDPLLLFAALHRQLGYPAVPFPDFQEKPPDLIPTLMRRIERLEARVKIIDEEQRGNFDLSKLFVKPDRPPPGIDELL